MGSLPRCSNPSLALGGASHHVVRMLKQPYREVHRARNRPLPLLKCQPREGATWEADPLAPVSLQIEIPSQNHSANLIPIETAKPVRNETEKPKKAPYYCFKSRFGIIYYAPIVS